MAALADRRMIDQIRAYIFSSDQTKSEEIEQLARQYAEACRNANERLTRCGDFLEKGLRTQAIHVAEAEPDLLEVVSVLNFAELDEWQELAGSYGLDRFEALKLDVASAVSQAYEIEKQLEGLLNQHRRLALAKAPIKDRLSVMRSIMAVDVTTPYWREDVLELETHRAAELVQMGERASRNGDVRLLEKWINECEAEQWTEDPPEGVASQYHRLARRVHETSTLPRLAQHITAAMRRLDMNGLMKLRAEWEGVAGRLRNGDASWKPPQHLQAAVYPAFEYLEQQLQSQRYEAFQQDVALFQQAMRSESGEEQVAFLLAKAESHGFPLPPMAQAEYAEYKRGAKEAKALNVAVIIALVIGGIMALVFGYFMIREVFNNP